MTIRKKIVFSFSTLFLLLTINSTGLYATEAHVIQEPENINATGAILVEKESMRVLWERNSEVPLPMASTTKIMTCILALEQGSLDDVVTASKRAAAAPKVKMYLRPGENQTLEDLLYALMLQSSNDAAIAIAEHIGGSVEEFCILMTQRAKELGTKATCFKTPNGLDAPGHMSSPHDLAIITKHAYETPEFLEIINTPSRSIPSSPLEGSRPHQLQNKNRFLTSYQGANGVKTGFTGLAGHSFVGGAKRDDMQLFAVVLASGWGPGGNQKKYSDATNLLNYGFEHYEIMPIKQKMDKAGHLPVIKGESDFISLAYGESLELPLTEGEKNQITAKLELVESLEAPVPINKSVGLAKIYVNNEQLGAIPIITTSSVERKTIRRSFEKAIERWTTLGHD